MVAVDGNTLPYRCLHAWIDGTDATRRFEAARAIDQLSIKRNFREIKITPGPCPWCWQGVCVRDSLRLENLHFDRTFLARRTLQPPLGADKKRWNYRAASIGQSRQSPRNRFGRSPFLEKPPAWNCIRSERAMFFSDRRCAWTSPWELIEPLWYAGDLRERKKKGGWETFDDSRGTQDYYRWKSGYFISNRIEKSARIRRDFRSTLLPRGNVKRHGIIRVI